MKQKILLMLCVFFAFITSTNAGELYHCIDSNGNSIITDTPQDGMTKCVLGDSYDDPTPQQRAQQQEERKNRRQEQAQQEQEDRSHQEAQKQRNQESMGKSRAELEKKRLESKKENSSAWFKKAVDKRKEELEKDPEQYFYDKEQREKEAASTPHRQHGVVIGPSGVVGHY